MLEFNLTSEKLILFSAKAPQIKYMTDHFLTELKKDSEYVVGNMLEFNLTSEKLILFSAKAPQIKYMTDHFLTELKKEYVRPVAAPDFLVLPPERAEPRDHHGRVAASAAIAVAMGSSVAAHELDRSTEGLELCRVIAMHMENMLSVREKRLTLPPSEITLLGGAASTKPRRHLHLLLLPRGDKKKKKKKKKKKMMKFRFRRQGNDPQREKIKQELFAFNKTVEHGFPHQPSSLAFDSRLQIMAIGTKSGAVKMYPFFLSGDAGAGICRDLELTLTCEYE
ncbi:hypothetical protein CRUP_026170 [Coryphaenoides rupestris]|nr:hypothetical protein CRUP_026170 [Coryphaenoides rupestris]